MIFYKYKEIGSPAYAVDRIFGCRDKFNRNYFTSSPITLASCGNLAITMDLFPIKTFLNKTTVIIIEDISLHL